MKDTTAPVLNGVPADTTVECDAVPPPANVTASDNCDGSRIKIWDKNNGDAVVYDNQMGAGIDDNPTTALGGGSILIHK